MSLITNLGASRQLQVPRELQPFAPAKSPGQTGRGVVGGLALDRAEALDGARGPNPAGIGAPAQAPGPSGTPLDSFAGALERELDAVNTDMGNADDRIGAFVSGEEHSVHEVMVAMNKADTSFRMLTTVTRRVVEAYQEIARMQV
ncbi:MAG: flagellar hook-basal body complex protein FliE [Myxococcota bacterium]|jgi:flagellar hook-basal body complex protein FliE